MKIILVAYPREILMIKIKHFFFCLFFTSIDIQRLFLFLRSVPFLKDVFIILAPKFTRNIVSICFFQAFYIILYKMEMFDLKYAYYVDVK